MHWLLFQAALGQFNAWNLHWTGQYDNHGYPVDEDAAPHANEVQNPEYMGPVLLAIYLLLATVLMFNLIVARFTVLPRYSFLFLCSLASTVA